MVIYGRGADLSTRALRPADVIAAIIAESYVVAIARSSRSVRRGDPVAPPLDGFTSGTGSAREPLSSHVCHG